MVVLVRPRRPTLSREVDERPRLPSVHELGREFLLASLLTTARFAAKGHHTAAYRDAVQRNDRLV